MSGAGADASTPVRKRRLRKGTHSCTECRRRKLRCNRSSMDRPCSPCLSRGSQCIDQRDETLDNGGSSRIPLITFATLPGECVGNVDDLFTHITGEGSGFPGEADSRAPFVSMLNAAQPAASASLSGVQTNEPQHTKRERIRIQRCTSLSKLMPEYSKLMSVLMANGGWWSSFRQKTRVLSQSTYVELQQFASDAYQSNVPADLGMLLVTYARSSGENQHLYRAVENVLFSDSSHAYSLGDLECLLLLAKAYSDVGLPRQAWHMYRKGIAISQEMGLHDRDKPAKQTSIWWAFYHGDRFMSMLLGLPYGFNDAHFGADTESLIAGPEFLDQRFILRCAFVAGKVIDRNVVPVQPSSTFSMLLDEQMDAIAASMPESWWELPKELPMSEEEIESLRIRLLQQFYFLHVRMVLHLPFLFSSSETALQKVHGHSCLEASRSLLKRFILLRSIVNGSSIFDCKTSDFVGFMGAVVLTVGWSRDLSSAAAAQTPAADDIALLERTRSIFSREESEKGCRIAAQCRMTLELLCEHNDGRERETRRKITIPYFGSIKWEPSSSKPEEEAISSPQTNERLDAPEMEGIWNQNLTTQNSGINPGEVQDFDHSMGMNWTLDVSESLSERDFLFPINVSDITQDWSTSWDGGWMM
uniref:Zn(2)-C6 fungal-type domain-containing protein n=1 Tax=Bionectria ochroleuca TaxID=29856 RepID=A0A8H7NJ60_BIOOC